MASMSPNLPRHSSAKAPAAASPAVTAASVATSAEGSDTPLTVAPAPVDRGDLSHGSLTRKLAAGDRTLVIDYWTDADPASLTAAVPSVLKLSAHIEDADGTHAVKVTRFLATLDDGKAIATVSEDRGEFVLTPPYSYGTALTLRPTDPTASAVTLSVEFDLLVETAPGSGAFFRQTVLDNVRIAFPPKGAAS